MNASDPSAYAVLFVVGVAVSFINSVSGGGSALSLPLLMMLGLPAAEANGTNRVGIAMGALAGVAGFWKKGLFYPRLAWRVGWPGLLGAVAGSWVGITLPDALFKPALAVVILFIVFETARPRAPRPQPGKGGDDPDAMRSGFWPFLAYAGIGFYGGFIHAGAGLIMMYVFSRFGTLNLLQINALKVSNACLFVSLSLLMYGWAGKVQWGLALVLALGNAVGGYVGSIVQVQRGERFVRLFLLVTGPLLAAKLVFEAIRALF